MKRVILVLLFIFILGASWYAYHLYTGKVKSLNLVDADVTLSAASLVEAFQKDSADANKKYLGKVISLNGMVKVVEPESSTIVLGDSTSNWSIRCSMHSNYVNVVGTFKPGNVLHIKGNCTGFLPDDLGLGSDIVLNRCVIESNSTTDQ
jgi:hypothetical protein